VLELLPFFRRIGASVIALTGRSASRLGREADVTLLTTVAREADPLGLAPTSSTTVQLGVGDALAVMVTRLRGLRQEDFALFHPGGALGRKLLLRVDDLMGPPERLPSVGCHASVQDALFEITSKGYGATCVVDDEGLLVGVFTDGDLRRLLERRGVQAMEGTIAEAMTTGPKTIGADRLAVEALRLMESWEVTVLIVVDGGRPRAMIHLHELLKAGLA
jgi:arabinose-5-phosphate isomerase